MTTIPANRRVNNIHFSFIMIALSLLLALLAIILIVAPRPEPTPPTPEVVPATSASVALSNGLPTLMIFIPVEKCEQQYCLSEPIATKQLQDRGFEKLNVVEVPVSAISQMTAEAPPDYLFVHWDLYPVPTIYEWMPRVVLTDHGWGLADTHIVLLSENGEHLLDLGNQLNLDALAKMLQE